MKLLDYIELHKSKAFEASSQTALDKLRQTTDSLAAYPPAADADLHMLQTTDFIIGYGTYLHTDYPRHYSPSVCADCIKRLRTLLRYAIEQGDLPNYDPIPEALQHLHTHLWHTDDTPPEAKPIELDTVAQLEALARALTWASVRHTTVPTAADPKQARHDRDEMTSARAAMIYLFGVLFMGLDVADVLRLPAPTDGKVYVERYRRHVKLPAALLELVRMHNAGKVIGSPTLLFHALPTADDPKFHTRAATIERRAHKWIKRQGINIVTRRPIDIAITVAHDCGIAPTSTIETLIRAVATGTYTDLSDHAIGAICLARHMALKSLRQSWYALCSYSPRLRGSQLRDYISRSGILGTRDYALTRLYDPSDRTELTESTRLNAINRFLFFRATPYEAKFVDMLHTDASVIRRRDNQTYAIIPQVEIEFMQAHLRDFRDDVQLIDRDQWMHAHASEFVKQAEVIIHEGPFKGYTATIVDIKHHDDSETYYILELPHDHYTIKATRSALSIEAKV